jgi:uncharacterized membrane protein HdeD (DUF308 family)
MTALSLRSRLTRHNGQLALPAPRHGCQASWMSAGVLILAAGELIFLWPDIHPTRLLMPIPLWMLSIGVWQIATALRHRG